MDDDDDVVARLPRDSFVLVYIASLAVYPSDITDQKESSFQGDASGAVLVVIFVASFIVAVYETFWSMSMGIPALAIATLHCQDGYLALLTEIRRVICRSPY